MLDIQGQPAATADTQGAIPASGQPVPNTPIPSVTGATVHLTSWTAGGLVLLMIIAGAYLSFSLTEANSLAAVRTRDVDAVKAQLDTPANVTAEATANQLKTGVSAIQALLEKPSPWSALLKTVAQKVPNAVTLTNLSTTSGLNFRMTGTATTYLDLAQFLTALEHSPSFTQTTLESANMSDAASGSTVSFSITATFVPPASGATTVPTNAPILGGTNGQ